MHIFSFILATLLISAHIAMSILFSVYSFKGKYKKAEVISMIDGYYLLGSMIVLFILMGSGYNSSNIELERDYSGAWFTLAIIPIGAMMVISEFKLQSWIKNLSVEDRKKHSVSLDNRRFVIVIIIILSMLNFLLYGINLESFLYIVLS